MILGSESNYIDTILVNSKGVVRGWKKIFDEKIIYFDSKRSKISKFIDKI